MELSVLTISKSFASEVSALVLATLLSPRKAGPYDLQNVSVSQPGLTLSLNMFDLEE